MTGVTEGGSAPAPDISRPPPGPEWTGWSSITGDVSADFRDPYVWHEGEHWYLLIGAGLREKGGTALLYESEDLRHWRHLRPTLTGVIGTDCNLWECPVLLRSDARGALLISPHPEAKYVYWIGGRNLAGETLTPASKNPFSGMAGDCLEIEAEFSVDKPTVCDLTLRASPDQVECTKITYRSPEQTLTVDGSRSSLDPDVDHPIVTGPLRPDPQGVVRFRVFLDHSVLEVFVADCACVTQRLYPTRQDSLGLSFSVREGCVRVHRLSAWKLASIWPDQASTDHRAE